MANDDQDDLAFLEAMARDGVQPLDKNKPPRKQQTRTSNKPSSTASRAKSATQTAPGPAPSRPLTTPLAKSLDARASAAPSARQPNTQAPPTAAAADQKTLADLRQALARAENALEREQGERAHERDQQKREREQHEQALSELKRERARLENKNRQLRERIAQQQKDDEKHCAIEHVLTARGCMDRDEAVAVLRGLLDKRPDELLAAVELASAEALERLLDQRVAMVAHDYDVDMGEETVIVRVSPERCEITGGSDIQAEFRRFVDACARAQAGQITIVGGSPAYRRQLTHLAAPFARHLKLKLVDGTKRREKRRAEADKRNSALVVIWGATELDHSVSAVYTSGSGDKVLTVRHRGISGMLAQVTEHLDRSAG